MQSTKTRVATEPGNELTVLGPLDIGQMNWHAVPNCPGVYARELFRHGGVTVSLIQYAPSAWTPGRPHPTAEHHVWVVSGVASVDGRRIVAGSYAHVPADVAHPIEAVGSAGCTLLQVHVAGREQQR